MKETLQFLTILDEQKRRNHISDARKLHTLSTRDKLQSKKNGRYPYAKAIDFRQSKYNDYPRWLTQKEGFSEFMYKSYEKKLMSIPLICQKETRESQQKYFLAIYLQEIEIFKNLPKEVMELILNKITTKYYKAGQIIHNEDQPPSFMAVIYIGEVEYQNKKRSVVKQKNEVILRDAFQKKPHPTITSKEETILLALDSTLWPFINNLIRKEMEGKQRDYLNDLLKSTFFTELHIKDKKAHHFYQNLKVECYFQGQTIQEAGSQEKAFYLIFKGDIEEENHIYVREHNKWPLPNRRWEVRAVYNSYNQNKHLRKFNFFGDEEIMEDLKFKARYTTTTWTVVLKMNSEAFHQNLNQEDIKRLKKYRSENADVNYLDFQTEVRARTKSTSDKKKIVLKAINTSLNHKSEFSPKRMALIRSYEKSMLRKVLFGDRDKTISV